MDISTLGTSQMSGEQQSSATRHYHLKDVQYAVIGDNTTINIVQQKDSDSTIKDKINKVLSILRVLPGKPFHECFTRIQDVRKMRLLFEEMYDPNQLPCLSAIFLTGPPGSGKTQLARQFGEHFLTPSENSETNPTVVLTLNVDSVKSLLRSLKEVLESLGVNTQGDVNAEGGALDLLKTHLDELRKVLRNYPGDWLLIFDNLFRDENINSVLPKPGTEEWGKGSVIITSQDNNVVPAGHRNARNHSLKYGMDSSDAYALLAKVSGIKVDDTAQKLAEDVEYFPLSLACCATYVRQMKVDRPRSDFSWKEFSDLYHNEVCLTYRTHASYNIYPYSMVVATRLAVMRLAGYSQVLQHAFTFLSYCALNPVPLAIISCFVQERMQPNKIQATDEIKAEISSCSLLTASGFESGESIRFHQVLLDAFKYFRDETSCNLSDNDKQKEYVLMLKSLNASLETAIPNYDRRSVSLKIQVSSHLKMFVEYGNSLSWNNSPEFVLVLAHLADSLYHVPGSTERERVAYVEQAYKTSKALPDCDKNISYAQVLKCLGFYYRESGRVDESVSVLREALALTDGQTDQDWLRLRSSIMNVLSWSYKLQTKYDLAERTMQDSIKMAKSAFGEEHEEIVERLCNLGIIYREKHEMARAKETVDEARRIAEISTDKLHLNRAQAANYSAKVYLRCAEACTNQEEKRSLLHDSLKFHDEALQIYEIALGEGHIYVAGVSMTYAIVNKELQAYNKALEQVERAEKIYSTLGHVELRSALRYKTEVLLAMGNRSEQAERAIKRSIELSNCGRARFLLAQVYVQQRKFHEARPILEEVLVRWKSGVLPKTHLWVQQAEQLKSQCDKEILKLYTPAISIVLLLLISISLGFLLVP